MDTLQQAVVVAVIIFAANLLFSIFFRKEPMARAWRLAAVTGLIALPLAALLYWLF